MYDVRRVPHECYMLTWMQPNNDVCPTTISNSKPGHNFNLRIFNSRVSNPNKCIVDVFFDTMSDFNVPGSRPKTTR